MRALLDLIRDNEAAVQDISIHCRQVLSAAKDLTILDREHGDDELRLLVEAAYDKLSLPPRQPETGGATAGGGAGFAV